VARRVRRLNRTLAARTGQGKPTALRLTGEAGRLVERSIAQARRVAEHLRRRARGRGAQNQARCGSSAELHRLNLKPRDLALDGEFFAIGVAEDLPGPEPVFIAGRQSAGSKRTNRQSGSFIRGK
jgi:hypothetical protein